MPLIIAIDGPAAAGKSSVARALAKKLGLLYLDSGSLYRAMAWKVLQKGIDVMIEPQVEAICGESKIMLRHGYMETAEVWVDSENVTPFLRNPEVTRVASILAAYSGVRATILLLQRGIAQNGVVAEGRDMGTVVFPNADKKFYLDAALSIRGKRRYEEFQSKGIPCSLATIISEMEARDQRDQHRAVAPLRAAADAITIDSTSLSMEGVIAMMEQEIKEKLPHCL